MDDATINYFGPFRVSPLSTGAKEALPPKSTVKVFGLGLALIAVLVGPSLVLAGGNPELLHVATLNLAHGRGTAASQFGLPPEVFKKNIDKIASVIRRESPDLIALEEADAPSAWSATFDHVATIARSAGYPFKFHGIHFDASLREWKLQYGTAILSHRPLESPASYRFDIPPLHTKGFVTADVDFAGRPIVVAAAHLTSGLEAKRREEAGRITAVLSVAHKPIVLMGDLNSRWGDQDDGVRILAARLDLHAYQPDNEKLATFSVQLPNIRIDWILISPELEFVDYQVWNDEISDHFGVAATLRWADRPQK